MKMNVAGCKALVTGGAGFIGSHLVDELLLQRCNVTVVDNFFLGKEQNLANAKSLIDEDASLSIYREDASDYAAMQNILEQEKPQFVFNLAVKPLPYSFVNPEGAFMTSVNIANVLANLQKRGLFETLVHFSSSEAYGTALEEPMRESHPLNPTTPYSAGKASADLLLQSYQKIFDLDVRILRPFNNFGERQNDTLYAAVIPITIEKILSGSPPVIEWDGLQTRDFIYVGDTVKAALLMAGNTDARGKLVNVASGRETSIKELVLAICELMNVEPQIVYKPARSGDVRRHFADVNAAERLLGWKPETSLKDGLLKTIEYYKVQKIFDYK